jgi:hypothetical protein
MWGFKIEVVHTKGISLDPVEFIIAGYRPDGSNFDTQVYSEGTGPPIIGQGLRSTMHARSRVVIVAPGVLLLDSAKGDLEIFLVLTAVSSGGEYGYLGRRYYYHLTLGDNPKRIRLRWWKISHASRLWRAWRTRKNAFKGHAEAYPRD